MAEESAMMKSLQQLEKNSNGDASQVKSDTTQITEPPVYRPADIKEIRSNLAATQRVFALALAVSPRTVEAWETGRSKPSGSSRRLIQLLDKNPKLFAALIH